MTTYDPQHEFVPWLMAIARNKMVDRARRFARSIANEVLVDDLAEIGAVEPFASCAGAMAIRKLSGWPLVAFPPASERRSNW